MDEMLALLGDHPPCLLFKQLFLERLPEDIRIQLVDAEFETPYGQSGTWGPTPAPSSDARLWDRRPNPRTLPPLQASYVITTVI